MQEVYERHLDLQTFKIETFVEMEEVDCHNAANQPPKAQSKADKIKVPRRLLKRIFTDLFTVVL